jgi:hypothetical protein
MKLVLGLSLLGVAALPARGEAQVLCTLGTPATPYDSMADMPAMPSAQADLKKVKSALCPKGCGKVLLFSNPTSPNAVTVTDGSGVSKISYSPKFVASVQEKYGPAATLGIFAHELGHHIESTTSRATWMKAAWDGELRADAWAGCALAKMELRPSAAQAAVRALSTYPAAGHPDWTARAAVLRAGYTNCGGARTLPGALEEASDQESSSKDDRSDERRADRKGDKRGDRDRDDARATGGRAGGCSNDQDCRNGRTCSNGRCGIATGPKRCGKDTDCPEPQECNASGRCETPGGGAGQVEAEVAAPRETASPPEPRQTSPSAKDSAPAKELIAINDPVPKSSGKSDTAACAKACDEGRGHCVEGAVRELNQCIATVQSDASYKACACPNYPEGNYSCYKLCSTAYEQAKTCSTPDKVRDCKLEAERCRAHCH